MNYLTRLVPVLAALALAQVAVPVPPAILVQPDIRAPPAPPARPEILAQRVVPASREPQEMAP